jgi:hypothetical protein
MVRVVPLGSGSSGNATPSPSARADLVDAGFQRSLASGSPEWVSRPRPTAILLSPSTTITRVA